MPDTKKLRAQLFLVLSRGSKKIARWTAPLTIRMNDKAGDILYEILGKEHGGWLEDKERFRLNRCICTMAEGNAGGGATYRRFDLCREHARELFIVPSPGKIEAEKPAVKMREQKDPYQHGHHHGGHSVNRPDPSESMLGWHDGVYVTSAGLPGLGKHK